MRNKIKQLLKKEGVPTHFVRREDDRNQTVLALKIVPLEVIVRNIAAGSMAKRFGIEEGTPLKHPILEFCYKNDELGDPFANEFQITALGWATQEQLDVISTITLKVNDILKNSHPEKADIPRRVNAGVFREYFYPLLRQSFQLVQRLVSRPTAV